MLLAPSKNIYAGAKKPKIMVVPSDALLEKLGLLSEQIDDMGEDRLVQNYQKAFLNDEVKAVISKFSEMMKERGFPLVMMEHELKKAKRKNRQIHYDIRIDLNYKVSRIGPNKVLYVQFEGVDNYSSKQIAAASGESAPAIGSTVIGLLQEAVLDKIDHFNQQLQEEFNRMAEKGRESSLTIESEECALDEPIGEKTVEEFIDEWLTKNCVGSNFSIDDSDDTHIDVSQAMMPLFNEKGKAIDARTFYKSLVRGLKNFLSSQGYTCKVTSKKLSELTIIIK